MSIPEHPTEVHVIIVGAGISGLAAGRCLHEAGTDCCVLEKSRGVGGRCATRRFHGNSFDHGAQFLTVRNQNLRTLAEQWLEQGQIREWCCGFPHGERAESGADGFPRYYSSPGMNSLPKLLAAPLTIEKQILVTRIHRDGDGWHVSSECGRQWRSQALIMAAPLPQALAMLGDDLSGQLLTHVPDLKAINYDPCFTVMLALKGESQIPAPGAIRAPSSVIDWIADNTRKHDTGKPAAVTVHCSANFSRQHFDAPHEDVAARIIEIARPWLGCEVAAWQVHRWRYAKPNHSLAIPTVALGDKHPLLLCGDYLSAPARIEGAFDSGVAAAEQILAQS